MVFCLLQRSDINNLDIIITSKKGHLSFGQNQFQHKCDTYRFFSCITCIMNHYHVNLLFLSQLLILGLLIVVFCSADYLFSVCQNCESVAQLKDVPWANDRLILKSQLINFNKFGHWIYNPSIIKTEDGYLVIVRHDFQDTMLANVGYVRLNKDFELASEIKYYDLRNFNLKYISFQDARIFKYLNNNYLIYTYLNFKKELSPSLSTNQALHTLPWTEFMGMFQGLAQIDDQGSVIRNFDLRYIKNKPNVNGKIFEKNWVPFEFIDDDGQHILFFIHSFNPPNIIYLNEQTHDIVELELTQNNYIKQLNAWENKWGIVCGGTPAILIDDEYYTFFHSYFSFGNKRCYVFGAITFERKRPFKITRISKYPILHHSFYTSNTFGPSPASANFEFVLFPCGLLHEKVDKKDQLIVLCGENDEAVRLIGIDKSELLKNMLPC